MIQSKRGSHTSGVVGTPIQYQAQQQAGISYKQHEPLVNIYQPAGLQSSSQSRSNSHGITVRAQDNLASNNVGLRQSYNTSSGTIYNQRSISPAPVVSVTQTTIAASKPV